MLPVMRSNIATLLQDEAFKELLLELPELNFRLLAMLDSAAAAPEPLAKKRKLGVSDDDDNGEDDEDEEGHTPPRGTLHYRFGRGRTLG